MNLINVTPSMQTGMALLLLCAMLVIVRSLLRRSRLPRTESHIDLDMVLLEWNPSSGRYEMSIIRILAVGAFVLTAWVMVYITLSGKMSEGYLGLFNIMWVAPLVTAILKGRQPPPQAGPTTTIKTDSVTVENP